MGFQEDPSRMTNWGDMTSSLTSPEHDNDHEELIRKPLEPNDDYTAKCRHVMSLYKQTYQKEKDNHDDNGSLNYVNMIHSFNETETKVKQSKQKRCFQYKHRNNKSKQKS